MSLINDALKRTSAADKLNPIPRLAGPALQPVEEIPSASLPRGGLIGGIALIAALSAYLLWQYFSAPALIKVASADAGSSAHARRPATAIDKSAADTKSSAKENSAKETHATAEKKSALANPVKTAAATLNTAAAQHSEITSLESPAKPDAAAPHKSSAATPANNVAPIAPVPAEVSPAKTEVVLAPPAPPPPPPPPAFPAIRVQGLISRASNPSALINGRVLVIGDQIDDAKLTKIDPQGVTFELAGQTKNFPAPH
jgi:hypothetical protein